MLATSVESLKEVGILDYFLQLSDLKLRKATGTSSIKKETNSTCPPVKDLKTGCEDSCASLSDALVSECFVLYMYGIVIAFFVCLVEQLTRVRIKVGCTPPYI